MIMKHKDITDLKNKTVPELEKLAQDIQLEIAKAKMQVTMRKVKNTNLAKNMRRHLSVILSTKQEKENNANS